MPSLLAPRPPPCCSRKTDRKTHRPRTEREAPHLCPAPDGQRPGRPMQAAVISSSISRLILDAPCNRPALADTTYPHKERLGLTER